MSKWFKGNSRTHLAILAHVQEFLHNLSDLYKLSLFVQIPAFSKQLVYNTCIIYILYQIKMCNNVCILYMISY